MPTSLSEYEELFKQRVGTRRQGGEFVLCIPCPFCAARDWYVMPLEESMHSTSAVYCTECQRSARFEAIEGEEFWQDRLELIQVAGPPAPEWLPGIWQSTLRPPVRHSGGFLP